MTEEDLKFLYPMGLKVVMFGSPFMILVILVEWFFINKALVIPITMCWLVMCLTMWIIMLIIGVRKRK